MVDGDFVQIELQVHYSIHRAANTYIHIEMVRPFPHSEHMRQITFQQFGQGGKTERGREELATECA